jgi:acetolactate synthase-1/3 small subunit
MKQQHTITALVQNETGTINRLTSLFRRRGFSLASFNAGDCEEVGFSRITLVVDADKDALNQCVSQLEKLIDVVEAENLDPDHSVGRELVLVRCAPEKSQRDALYGVVNEFIAKTPRATDSNIVVELAGDVATIQRLLEALQPFRIVEIVRTGVVAMKVE